MAKEKTQNILYILKLSNEQDNYARCIQCLLALENLPPISDALDWGEFFEQYKNNNMDISHLSYKSEEFDKSRKSHHEEIASYISEMEGKSLFLDSKIDRLIEHLNGKQSSEAVNRKYLLVIDVSEDVSELFYFALMLQTLALHKFPMDTLFVYLRSNIDDETNDNKTDINDLYFRLSHYFANIKFEEVYSLYNNDIKRLSKNENASTAFIPILPIDSGTFDIIFNSRAGLSSIDQSKIHPADGAVNNKKLNTKKAIQSEVATLCPIYDKTDHIIIKMLKKFGSSKLEESLVGKSQKEKNPFQENPKHREYFLNTLVDSFGELSWFQFALLSMMIDYDSTVMTEAKKIIVASKESGLDKEENIKLSFKRIWGKHIEFVVELSDAIYQLAENIVNHTEKKTDCCHYM